MIVNHKHKFIFYHVPKAAGSSIRTALLTVSGSRDKPPLVSKHITPDGYLDSLWWPRRQLVKNYFSFCFVRDPFERFGSLHRYVLKLGRYECPSDVNDFASMLADGVEWVVQLKSIRPQIDYAKHVDFVGKFESIDRDFAAVAQRLGVAANLTHINSSGDRRIYREAFTDRTIDILSEFYRDDVALPAGGS